jgi:hypothetical protein
MVGRWFIVGNIRTATSIQLLVGHESFHLRVSPEIER